jgi:DNA-binding MarR family transcriptional regulator
MAVERMAGHLIRRLHQVSTQVFNQHMQAAGYDLTSVQFAALDAIAANPGVDQARIAGLISYDRATIGGVIDRLEQKGLVIRKTSPKDRRAKEVSLSPEGEAIIGPLFALVESLQPEILLGLDHAEREVFMTLARKALLASGTRPSKPQV